MISVIIVSYNSKKFITSCITSIKKYAPEDTETIAVDNNSTDGSVDELKKIKDIKLIESRDNLGYAKAVNKGMEAAVGEYIFILNPDTKLTKDSLLTLVAFSRDHPEAGIIGPKLLNPDGSIQSSCYHEQTLLRNLKEYFEGKITVSEKYAPSGSKPTKVDAIVGAAMLIPKSVIEKVGTFDQKYFMYFEDLDYCKRVRNAGLAVYYLPTATVYHEHGGITRELGDKPNKWLIDSSKIYYGNTKYTFMSLFWRIGQKVKRILKLN